MGRLRIQTFISAFLTLILIAGSPVAQAQSTGTVQGRVVSAATGSPIPGANVIVEGTTIGAATDPSGRYQLQGVPAGTQEVTVSYISYETRTETVEVEAGQSTTLNLEISRQTLEAGEVVVTGLRQSQTQAVTQKRQAVNVVDVISADDIGNLPEQNVAESVQRLPGIVIRNDRTEGRFVSIRGGAANLNNVTLNGNTLASTAGSRATALDLLPAELVSNIEVTKAVTPDMSGNAIGGSINISTLSAFDRKGTFAFGSVRGLTHDQQVGELGDTKFPFRANVTAGTKVGPNDEVGLLVSASGSRRDFTTSGLKGEFWEISDDYRENDITVTQDPDVPLAQEQIVERNRRSRFALNASIDWRPSNQTSVYLRPYFTYTDEKKLDNELEYNLLSDIPFGGNSPKPQRTQAGVSFPVGFGSVDLSDTDEEESLWGGSVGAEQQFGATSLSLSGTYTRGVLDSRQEDAEFETPVTPEAAGVADMSGFLFDFYPAQPGYVGDGANYEANEVDLEYAENIEDTFAGQVDLKVPFQAGGATGFLKTGGRAQVRDKTIDEADTGYDYIGDGSLTLADYQAPRIQTQQVGNGLMPFANTGEMVDAFLSDLCNPSTEQRFSGERRCRSPNAVYQRVGEEELAVSDIEGDSENQEQVYAGYGMASAEIGALTAVGGLRVEHTITETTRFQLVEGSARPAEQTFENSYTNFLPSVHLTFEATNALQFRAAWTNTIGRPEYDDLGAFSEVEISSGGGPVAGGGSGLSEAVVQSGNPELDPFTAMNFDLSAEYYFENGGLASVAAFYKRIDNAIYTSRNVERGSEANDFFQNRFGEGNRYRQVATIRQRNADLGEVLGVEASYQQPLTFLPSPFDGLGLNANLTVTDSEVEVPSREEDNDLPFFQQADLVYNVVPFFQKSGFEIRAALNYQGDYLEGLGDSPEGDAYIDDRTTIDVNSSYTFSNLRGQPELFVQVENLTNEPEVTYVGEESDLGFHYLSGTTTTVGLSVQL
jgi:TonB-dependent receptor